MTNTSDTPGAAGPREHGPYPFFEWLRGLGLVRPANGWVGGVCAGIGARTGLDPLVVRGVVLVIAVLGGPVLFFYAVAWALLPDTTGRIHAEDVVRGRLEPAAVAIGALLVLSLLPFTRGLWWQGPPSVWNMPAWLSVTFSVAWSLALFAGAIWLVVYLSTSSGRRWAPPAGDRTEGMAYATAADPTVTGAESAVPQAETFAPSAVRPGDPTSPAGSPWASDPAWTGRSDWERVNAEVRKGLHQGAKGARQAGADLQRWRATLPGAGYVAIVLGLAVIAGSLTAAAIGSGGRPDSSLVWGLAAATAVVGLGIIVAGIRGRSSGAMGFFSVVGIVALLAAGVFPSGTVISAFGTRVWTVSGSGTDPRAYAMVAGAPVLDLTELGSSPDREVDLWLGFGSATVRVPSDGSVTVEAHAVVGALNGPGSGADEGGFLLDDAGTFGTGRGEGTIVRVWMMAGNVDVKVAQ